MRPFSLRRVSMNRPIAGQDVCSDINVSLTCLENFFSCFTFCFVFNSFLFCYEDVTLSSGTFGFFAFATLINICNFQLHVWLHVSYTTQNDIKKTLRMLLTCKAQYNFFWEATFSIAMGHQCMYYFLFCHLNIYYIWLRQRWIEKVLNKHWM